MTTKAYDVYGMGNALLDVQYRTDTAFLQEHGIAKGMMTYVSHEAQSSMMAKLDNVQQAHHALGGSVANSMIALQYFGAAGFYTCKIADDEAGHRYYQAMKAAGLDCSYDSTPLHQGQTGRCVVKITPDADRTMSTFLGISIEMDSAQLNTQALAQSRYLYIEGYLTTSESAMEAVHHAKTHAEKHGVKVALTLSDPAIVEAFRPQFHSIIDEGVDLLFCNEAEAMAFAETDVLEEAIATLKTHCRGFALTQGARGSLLFDGENMIRIEPTAAEPIDTLGAGDMYAGAFLYGLTQGLGWKKSGELANITSSKVVTCRGPRISQEDAHALLAEIHALPETESVA